MKNQLVLLSLCLTFFQLSAQQQSELGPCGTQQGRSKWLKTYQQNPASFAKGGDTTVYIPLTIHLVGTDDGLGYFPQSELLDAFCLLNELFEPTGLQFFIQGEFNYLNNSAYFSHETVLEGAEMMFANNVPNTLNCYFVSDPAGNCGYNLPYAGIAMAKSCSGPFDITWAHEIGHGLSLPHPFLGWEGGVEWDGSVNHSFSDPAPLTVTYDYTFFQDTLILDTMIIDTAYVEKIDGSNCNFAADGFCDTAPDYLANRWNCNGNGVSSTIQHDPDSVAFQSDGSLIMNYANDACQDRFSLEQKGAMRAFLFAERSQWVSDQPPLPAIGEAVVLTGPDNGSLLPLNQVELTWEPVSNATNYIVEVSRLTTFPSALTATFNVEEPYLLVPDLDQYRTYHWRVRPYNAYSACTETTGSRSFMTDGPEAATTISGLQAWDIFPQPTTAGSSLNLHWQMDAGWSGQLQWFNALGELINESPLSLPAGTYEKTLDIPATLPGGVYWLVLTNGRERTAKRLLIQ